MPKKLSVDTIRNLMDQRNNIRNIAVIAHVDHGLHFAVCSSVSSSFFDSSSLLFPFRQDNIDGLTCWCCWYHCRAKNWVCFRLSPLHVWFAFLHLLLTSFFVSEMFAILRQERMSRLVELPSSPQRMSQYCVLFPQHWNYLLLCLSLGLLS